MHNPWGIWRVQFLGGISHFSWRCQPHPVPLNQTSYPNMYITDALLNWAQKIALKLQWVTQVYPDPHFGWEQWFLQLLVMLHACSAAKLCSTPCDPMDCSPQGSSVHGVSRARILKLVAISFSRWSSQPSSCSSVSLLHANCLLRVCFPGNLF